MIPEKSGARPVDRQRQRLTPVQGGDQTAPGAVVCVHPSASGAVALRFCSVLFCTVQYAAASLKRADGDGYVRL